MVLFKEGDWLMAVEVVEAVQYYQPQIQTSKVGTEMAISDLESHQRSWNWLLKPDQTIMY